jgi:hypothetical protein
MELRGEGSVNFFEDSLVRVDGAGGPIESVRAYAFTFASGRLKCAYEIDGLPRLVFNYCTVRVVATLPV